MASIKNKNQEINN